MQILCDVSVFKLIIIGKKNFYKKIMIELFLVLKCKLHEQSETIIFDVSKYGFLFTINN